ncbi:MAG: Eco57I restriction-modification methylase domain-containing protein, partial [Chloroherpetonaceae bacterium]|nr:Eco57I restriction-modification methylase domain-containing protein [Chloroherpetonaceae bacterium]
MTTLSDNAKTLLRRFEFKELFNELGWDNFEKTYSIAVKDQSFALKAIAEKRGVQILICQSETLPLYQTRCAIHHELQKLVREHLIIFCDNAKTVQIWLWSKRENGRTYIREHRYDQTQSGEALFQKLQRIAFTIDEEEALDITTVTFRLKDALDREKVTKRFYDLFGKEQKAFLNAISGIPDGELQQWYAAVMISRLMFIYFIEKKGFLDDNANYLRSKLNHIEQSGQNFYREFLIPLFFNGFAQEPHRRSPQCKALLGDIPYLNGGLFLPHSIEEKHGKTIQIPNSAFKNLFDFFDQYQWHLDDRPLKNDREINPDVLGYIFERYVNNKQMGAYYTKEDITGYISENSILPCIFDKVNAIKPDALPNPNDFITRNESLHAYLLQKIEETDSLSFLHALYFKALKPLTILDPTVGSGAFLFAALKLLLPLYASVLARFRSLVAELDFSSLSPQRKALVSDIQQELAAIMHHKSEDYFILKTIVLNNLYGVDIVEEAVEICKLRLFLKLVATIDDKADLEPLPDIDFNIKAGNSLIGLLDQQAISLELQDMLPDIERFAQRLQDFRRHQLLAQTASAEPCDLQQEKAELLREEKRLIQKANRYVKIQNAFHWLIEFNAILQQGGFDVIIGNPPYVSTKKVSYTLTEFGFKTADIYGYCIARALQLLKENGRFGFIVMHSLAFSRHFTSVRDLMRKKNANIWFSFYGRIPAGLFAGDVRVRNCIFLFHNANSQAPQRYTTRLHRWFSEQREQLFKNLKYAPFKFNDVIPMFNDAVEAQFFESLPKKTCGQFFKSQKTKYPLYFKQSAYNWIAVSPS